GLAASGGGIATVNGSLVLITFHVVPGAAVGGTVLNLAANTPVQTVLNFANDPGNAFPFAVAPVDYTNFSNTALAGPLDGIVSVTAVPVNTTISLGTSSGSAVYGTPPTFTATVT